MKKLACLVFATAFSLVAVGQTSKAATPAAEKATVISSNRVFVKPGHGNDFRAALGKHVQKYHKGDSAQRVYEVISGPDSGGYHVVTGPTTWTAIDDRKGLGEEHNKDYADTVVPHIERRTPTLFGTYSKTLSTVAAAKFSEKALIRRYTIKPGMNSAASDYLKAYKPVWEKQGLVVAVWQAAFSGPPAYSVVFRLTNGFKDFDADLTPSRKVMEEIVGPNEYARLQAVAASAFESVVSELIVYKPELSSK